MLRTTKDVIDYTKTRSAQRAIELLYQEEQKKLVTLAALIPDLDAIIAIYDADEKHELAAALFKTFNNLGITTSEKFTQLVQKRPDIADYLFQLHTNSIGLLYYDSATYKFKVVELKQLADLHALSVAAVHQRVLTGQSSLTLAAQDVIKQLYNYTFEDLSDTVKFIRHDTNTIDGPHFAERFPDKIISANNLLKLSALKPNTLNQLLSFGRQALLNLLPTLSPLTDIFTRMGSEVKYDWSRDQLWQMVELLMQEELHNAAATLLGLIPVAPKLTMDLLRRSPDQISELFNATQFLNLLACKNGTEFAIEIIKLRQERIKVIASPFGNFVNLIQLDQKQKCKFIYDLYENSDWTNILCKQIRYAEEFMALVKADRVFAYTLMQRHPQLVLRHFATRFEPPKTKTITDAERFDFIKRIDQLIAENAVVQAPAHLLSSQSVFAGSTSSKSAPSATALPQPS